MSNSDRGDRGALVALAIVVIAVVIVSFFDWAGEPSNQVVGQPASAYIKANQNGDVAQSVASSNNFDPWLDSYAQWVMAVLSVVATGVSIWAVLFLRGTLRETQETNRIQNESLKWQRRALSATEGAILGITKLGIEFDKPNAAFTYSLTFKNTGKSPAIIQGLWFTEAVGKKIPENPKLGMVVKAT